jgi:spermidine/putrescine transport system substrate-binding protein
MASFQRFSRRDLLASGAALTLILGIQGPAFAADELNALVWCDHTDPALIEPFEKANNVKVNLKTFEGTGAALSILEQSQPGDWDVMVTDGVDVPRIIEKGLLAPLDLTKLPMDDLFPEVRLDAMQSKDGKQYGVTEKYGYNTISFNKDKVKIEDLEDMTALWSGKFKGRIAVYDYYMPMIGLMQTALGKKTADLKEADLVAIGETLAKLKGETKLVGEVVASQTALATGEVDILFGGGEWVSAALAKENPAMDWMIPKQGALRWSQSLTVLATSKKQDLATKFIAHVLSPEGQAALATSSCYWAMPSNKKAGAVLTPEQKASLRWDQQPEFLKNSQLYPSPSAELDAKMQETWTAFLQK